MSLGKSGPRCKLQTHQNIEKYESCYWPHFLAQKHVVMFFEWSQIDYILRKRACVSCSGKNIKPCQIILESKRTKAPPRSRYSILRQRWKCLKILAPNNGYLLIFMRGQHSIILIYICMKRHIFQRIMLAQAILMLVKNGFDLQYFIEGVRWEENIFSILQCEMNLSSKKKLLIVKLYIFAYVLLLK